MQDVDLDELLELLNKKEELRADKKKLNLESCERFIKTNGIVKGLNRVPNYVIYYTYKRKYKAKLSEQKWSKHHFFRLFNKIFDQVRTGRQRCYLLDGKSFDLSREGLMEAKKYDEEYKVEVKKRRGTYKKRKRRKRVSIPKEES